MFRRQLPKGGKVLLLLTLPSIDNNRQSERYVVDVSSVRPISGARRILELPLGEPL